MSTISGMRRGVALLVLLMAALLVSSTLGVSDAEAGKKKKPITIRCKAGAFSCIGNSKNNNMIGTSGRDIIFGEAGNDKYYGNDGDDGMADYATTSNDTYTGYTSATRGTDLIEDRGGSNDLLDLSAFASDDVVAYYRDFDGKGTEELFIDFNYDSAGNPQARIVVKNFKGSGEIAVKFSNVSSVE